MSNTVSLECSCGSVKGNLSVIPGAYFHVHCLCCDCQSFAYHLKNQEKILDQYGGSELFQTYPAFMKITEGKANIGCVQLRNKGLYRFYTTCCDMPLANTMNSSKIPFVGISVKLMKFSSEQEKFNVLGPVTMKAFGKYSLGEIQKGVHSKFPMSYIPKVLIFMLKGLVGKKYNPSPFFNRKEPVVEVNLLS